MKDNIISVKAFAEKNNISQQAVYKKIHRNSDRLNGHISKQNGKMVLDNFAQEQLKPADINFTLAEKMKRLENLLAENKSLTDKTSENEALIEKLKNEISEKNTEIENLKNRIIELTDKSLEIAELKNMLEEVLSENANSGIGKSLEICLQESVKQG